MTTALILASLLALSFTAAIVLAKREQRTAAKKYQRVYGPRSVPGSIDWELEQDALYRENADGWPA